MDKHRIKMVQTSYARVFPRKAEMAARFYDHLFRLIPEARPMFHKDMYVQREMFTTMLAMIVKSTSNPAEFEQMGKRLLNIHAHVNVTAAHYHVAIDAVIAALRDVLKDDFDAEMERAWTEAMNELISHMTPFAKG